MSLRLTRDNKNVTLSRRRRVSRKDQILRFAQNDSALLFSGEIYKNPII